MTQFDKDRIKFLTLNDGLHYVNAYINMFFDAMQHPAITIPMEPVHLAMHHFVDDTFQV